MDLIRRILKVWIFLALCGFALVDFALFSVDNVISKYLKFSVIVACALLAYLIRENLHDLRDRRTIQIAATLTVVADFLIGIMDQFLFGIGVFILVHSVYIFRHLRGFVSLKRELLIAVPVLIVSCIILYLAAPTTQKAGILVPSIVYAFFLATSLYAGLGVKIRNFFPGEDQGEILTGIILFFITDIMVALNAGLEGEAKQWTSIGIWLFYLPSQYFLAMSGYRRNPIV
ncbi:MAG: hypothetical protein JNM27_19090 [Leptospirales bacterium]|nr:hypothetical protein [Leptospirales bacterium]